MAAIHDGALNVARDAPAHADALASVSAFLYREARLLDERDFESWIELFTDDGVYWVPLRHDQTDHVNEMSIFRDDRSMLRARVARLRHPDAHADIPPPRTVHALSNIEMLRSHAAEVEVAAVLAMTEWREQRLTHYAARVTWLLQVRADGDYRIRLKRVELVNCDGFHQYQTVPF